MKLTKRKKQLLKNNQWDVIEVSTSKTESNCMFLNFSKSDGSVYFEICEHLGLLGDRDIKVLVVATQEGDTEEVY